MLLKTDFLRVSLFCSINNYCIFSVSQITPLQNVSFPTAAEADNAKETGSKMVSQAVSLNLLNLLCESESRAWWWKCESHYMIDR